MAQREEMSELTWDWEGDLEEEDRKRRKYSPRPCPHCGVSTLIRYRRPLHLRVLRLARIDVARYRCDSCSRRSSIRRA